MKGFNINKIKIRNSKEPSVEEKLSGEKISNLKDLDIKPNAELAGKEYLRFPDGEIVQAEGQGHDKSGVKMNLPDGTLILSNKLGPTAQEIKALNKEYNLKLKKGQSFSEVQSQIKKSIGLNKLYEEQQDLISNLDKLTGKEQDPDTKKLNEEFLTRKISEIEDKKTKTMPDFDRAFNQLYQMQESRKKTSDQAGKFENGGMSKANLNSVLDKYGITEEEFFKSTESIPEYQDGGGIEIKFDTDRVEIDDRVRQTANEMGFGQVTEDNIEEVMAALYRNFPDIVKEEFEFNLGKESEEELIDLYRTDPESFWNRYSKTTGKTPQERTTADPEKLAKEIISNRKNFKDLNYSEQLDEVYNFQNRANKRIEGTADYIISHPDLFSEEQINQAKEYKTNQSFDESTARGFDRKLGNFTGSRYSLGLSILNPEEKQRLADQGIFTAKQLKTALASDPSLISDETKVNFDKYYSEAGEDVDFRLEAFEGEHVHDSPETVTGEPIEDDIVTQTMAKYPRYFANIDQRPLPPSPMEAHLKGQTRLQRIDPIQIGTENAEQQLSNQLGAALEQVNSLPPNQRAAAIASMQSGTNESLNQAIVSTNQLNAQNQASAELYNIGQQGREQEANLRNALSFEQRQMMTKGNTEEQTRRYFDRLNSIALNRFQNDQQLNLIDAMSPDFSLDYTGTQVNFTPSYDWKLQDQNKIYQMMLAQSKNNQ